MTTWQTVHVRVNDASTGKPIPVRISFQNGERFFAPFGRKTDFPVESGEDVGAHLLSGTQRYSWIGGTCEIRLPSGEIDIEVTRGPEYSPLSTRVTLKPGQLAIRLSLERWIDLRPTGWVSGDTHALELSPHAALLEGAGEDLSFVNLLATSESMGNIVAFSGPVPTLEKDDCQVIVNTRNGHAVLGTLGLLCSHRAVYPLRFGGEDGDGWSLQDWCEQCHRKKGLVVWSDLGESRLESEALANAISGQIDAFEFSQFEEVESTALDEWIRLLDIGLRLPIVAGSRKDSNGVALGSVRTYAFLGPEVEATYRNWIEAIREGRTFVTNGPILSVTVNGEMPGSVLQVEQGATLDIQMQYQSTVPIEYLEILINGETIEAKHTSGTRLGTMHDCEWSAEESSWIVARCWCEEKMMDGQCPVAITSPIYVEVEGQPMKQNEESLAVLREHLTSMLTWVNEEANCRVEKEREHLRGIFEAAMNQLATQARSKQGRE